MYIDTHIYIYAYIYMLLLRLAYSASDPQAIALEPTTQEPHSLCNTKLPPLMHGLGDREDSHDRGTLIHDDGGNFPFSNLINFHR